MLRPCASFSLVASLLLALTPAVARAQSVAAAETLFNKGLTDMEAGRLDTACPALAESYNLDPQAGALFTLAECEKKAGKLASALAHYRDYLAAYARMTGAKKFKHDDRARHSEEQTKILAPQVPMLTLLLPPNAPANVKVVRDGVELGSVSLGVGLPVDPGQHVVSTQVPGGERVETQITISAGEAKTITLNVRSLAPESRNTDEDVLAANRRAARPWQRPVGFATLGLGVAGLGASGVLAALATDRHDKSNADNHCNAQNFCDPVGLSLRQDALGFARGSTVAFAVGGVLSVGGLVLVLTAPSSKPRESKAGGAVRLGMTIAPGGLGMRGTW